MTDFDKFLASAEKVPYSEFLASRIARESCIEDSWWPKVKPVNFVVMEDQAWFAEFPDGSFWTMIERNEYSGSLEILAFLVWSWLQEEFYVE